MSGEHIETIVISSDSEEDEQETIVISSDSEEDEQETIVISSDSEEDEQETIVISSDSEEDEQETIVISSDSEEDEQENTNSEEDEQEISNSEEDEQEITNSEEDEQEITNSEDDEPIPSDGETNSEEDKQLGRGVKRKAQNQDVEQEPEYYQIQPGRSYHSKKFNMTAKNYSVHFNNALGDVDLLESRNRTYRIFDQLIEDVTRGINPNDQVRFVLQSDQLQFPISIPFCPLEELTVEKVLSNVEKVVQSNEDFRLNDTVTINLNHVEMPRGSGKCKRTTLNIRDHLKKKKSVILINNRDDLC